MFARCLTALAFTCSLAATSAQANQIPASEGFEKIKKLAGTWIEAGGNEMGVMTYELTGNGSAVVELMGGMTTMYHQDNEKLIATHYCSAGNQPRMRANETTITSESIAFDFLDITNLRPGRGHINSVKLIFVSDDELIQEWTYREGETVGEPFQFRFTRVEPYKVTVEQTAAQQVVGIRKTTTFAELEDVLQSSLRDLRSFAAAQNLELTGFPLARYEVFNETEIVVVVGLPYEGDVATTGDIATHTIAASRVATVTHVGTAESSGAGYEVLHGWMAANQREAIGAPWELMLTDIATTIPERRVIKIMYPIAD